MAQRMDVFFRFGRRILCVAPLRRLFDIMTGAEDESWGRLVMNRETRRLVDALLPKDLAVLEISGTDWSTFGRFKEYRTVGFPDYDVCVTVLPEKFDLIIAEQVFEHLLWPYRAGENVLSMLRPRGYFLITVPFLVRIHNFPIDCTRWTETGLKYFLAECGFPIDGITTGSWGNRACVKANYFRWARYRRFFHSLKNESDFPIQVWALARK